MEFATRLSAKARTLAPSRRPRVVLARALYLVSYSVRTVFPLPSSSLPLQVYDNEFLETESRRETNFDLVTAAVDAPKQNVILLHSPLEDKSVRPFPSFATNSPPLAGGTARHRKKPAGKNGRQCSPTKPRHVVQQHHGFHATPTTNGLLRRSVSQPTCSPLTRHDIPASPPPYPIVPRMSVLYNSERR